MFFVVVGTVCVIVINCFRQFCQFCLLGNWGVLSAGLFCLSPVLSAGEN